MSIAFFILGKRMIYNCLKPNKPGVILFSILALTVIIVIFFSPIFLGYWLFLLSLSIFLSVVYLVSMVYGRKIEIKMGVKDHSLENKTFILNRNYKWFFVVIFLVAAILVETCSWIIAKAMPFTYFGSLGYCGSHRLECCEDGPYVSEVLNIDEEGDFSYGEIDASGTVDRFQCLNCGYALKREDGSNIDDNEEVVEWIENNSR